MKPPVDSRSEQNSDFLVYLTCPRISYLENKADCCMLNINWIWGEISKFKVEEKVLGSKALAMTVITYIHIYIHIHKIFNYWGYDRREILWWAWLDMLVKVH